MYEQSYKAYRRAQQLDPSNVRLRNDCALIAIYHLDRDWDLSKQLLDSAIADGEKMLRDNPPADRQRAEAAARGSGRRLLREPRAVAPQAQQGRGGRQGRRREEPQVPPRRAAPRGARRHLQEAERLLQGK
jgi:hypothetical protein